MRLLLGFWGIVQTAHAQTPTTNLTTHEPTITTNFEWHNALPIGSGNVVGTPTAVAPNVYYGVYNYGTCYSEPSPIRVATNTCPATTVDFRTLVDSTAKPSGTFVTFHSASPVSDANKINATAITAAGTYFTAYYDATSLCYTEESVIVMVVTSCAVPTLSIAATSATIAEGNSGTMAFTFTVTRAANTTGATTVDYTLTGSGTNPANAADFGGTLPTGTVSFAAGETSKVITVNVSGDIELETDETFTVTLSNPSGSATITTATATGTIQNDDSAVAVMASATIIDVTSATITGNAPSVTGGTPPYTYSDGSSDPACIAPSGYTSLTGAGGTVNGLNASTGAHTVTAPSAAGSYYYCIKVCDASGSNCTVSKHTITVTVACISGNTAPDLIKN